MNQNAQIKEPRPIRKRFEKEDEYDHRITMWEFLKRRTESVKTTNDNPDDYCGCGNLNDAGIVCSECM